LDSKVLTSFPRVNLISILAGTMALISVFLPWWGISGSAYGFSASVNWSLWGQPYIGDPSSSAAIAKATMTMGVFNVMVLALVFITAALAFLGSFDANKAYIATGFAASITTLLVYAAAVSYTLTTACQAGTSCPSGPIGSTVFASGDIANWGFQTGFYLLLLAGILTLFAVIFHQAFLRPEETIAQSITSHPVRFCSNCATPLQTNAKFCSHCASPVPG
jgi:hypothetical protein